MYFYLKRIFDFLFAFFGIIILSIPMLIIAIMIKLESKGKVFFTQKRIGKNKKFFYIYKFRTMKTNTPANIPTHMLENPDLYITKIGAVLRKTSLDELPQMFNVLKGDMSIIGPRPALWNQTDLIKQRDKYNANNLKPGITGLAQINGRDELPIDIKAKYDGEYAEKVGFLLDIKILISTIKIVIKGSGIHEGVSINEDGKSINYR